MQVSTRDIEQYRRAVGVRAPVRVDTSLTCGGGEYRGTDAYGAHLISVSATLPAPSAARLIIHELIHALQCERAGSYASFQARYRLELERYGYHNAPLELEAYNVSDRLAIELMEGD